MGWGGRVKGFNKVRESPGRLLVKGLDTAVRLELQGYGFHASEEKYGIRKHDTIGPPSAILKDRGSLEISLSLLQHPPSLLCDGEM